MGFNTVAISMGEAKHASRYCGKLAPSIDCLVSPDNTPYKTYGMKKAGMKELMSFNVGKEAMKIISKGHRGGQVIGDPTAMPATFLVDTNGIIQFVHYNRDIADHVEQDVLQNAMSQMMTNQI